MWRSGWRSSPVDQPGNMDRSLARQPDAYGDVHQQETSIARTGGQRDSPSGVSATSGRSSPAAERRSRTSFSSRCTTASSHKHQWTDRGRGSDLLGAAGVCHLIPGGDHAEVIAQDAPIVPARSLRAFPTGTIEPKPTSAGDSERGFPLLSHRHPAQFVVRSAEGIEPRGHGSTQRYSRPGGRKNCATEKPSPQ